MAWTTPGTAVAGDVLTAAFWNSDVRDNMMAGHPIVTSSTRPASPFEGQMIYETDTDKVLVYTGSTWIAVVNTITGSAVSVVGRSANSTGERADITASADNQVLRRASGALGFGTIPVSSVSGIQYGVVTPNAAFDTTVTFSPAFTSTPSISLTYNSPPFGNATCYISSPSASSFVTNARDSGGLRTSGGTLHWIAVGL
jgi:hypothetical protein